LIGYKELSQFPVFSIEHVNQFTHNQETSRSVLKRLLQKELVQKIKRNLYSCINPATGLIIATRYQIASALTKTAYISHHTAFEFYGLTNQVYYEVYCSSQSRFREFEFDNVVYKYIVSKSQEGVVEPFNQPGVRITDVERTVIESIRDFSRIGGFEELINSLSNVSFLNEEKLRRYLRVYDLKFLYQKTGYLMEKLKPKLNISKDFITFCQSNIGKSSRYLLKDQLDNGKFVKKWRLVVPESYDNSFLNGGEELV